MTATWGLACPRCGRADLLEALLPPRGTVAAFTVLTVPGDEFLNDAPYAYVVVELEGGGRVTGWMPSVRSENDLAIGERVHFVAGYKPGVQFAKDAAADAAG
ncbi:MAG: OB-fold domain-containing protein [Thermoplasmata archaeon]